MKKILLLLPLLLLFSCNEDFLDRGSLTQLAERSFWQNEKDAQLGINGVYEALQSRVLYSGNLNGTAGLPQHDSFADNTFNNYKFEGPGNFVEARVDPSTSFFNEFWTANYRGIARANTAITNIERIPEANISAGNKTLYLGQARFLRGLFYMNLAIHFEDVPLILKVQSLEEAYVPKNTYKEVSDQIITDLKFASESLPATYPASLYGYATKGAALSLLARFQLYNKNYQEVVALTSQILTLGYSLNSSYEQLFTLAGENSKEIIFAVRFVQDQSDNGETFSATFTGIPKVNLQPMRNLVNDYYATDGLPITKSPLYKAATPKENRDPRLAASVYFRNDIFLTDLNRPFTGNTATTFGLKKYVRSSASASGIGVGSPGGQDFYVMRYADVLLMRAEALVETNQLTEVYALVNQVRARAKMPRVDDVEKTGLTQAQLRDIVRHERRIELAFEGLRFFDVKRWGEVEAAYKRAASDNVAAYKPVYRGRQSEVFPIPQSEIDANKSLVQNPVWK